MVVSSKVSLWDCKGTKVTDLEECYAKSAIFAPDGQTFATISSDKTVRLWNLAGQPLANLQGHINYITSAVFAPDSQTIITVSENKSVHLWDVAGKLIAIWQAHTSCFNSAIFAPDGQTILTFSSIIESLDSQSIEASYASTMAVRLWDRKGTEIAVLQEQGQRRINFIKSVTFASDGQTILTASSVDPARLWNRQGQLVAILEGYDRSGIDSAIFASDSQTIVTTSIQGHILLFDFRQQPRVSGAQNNE